jgi:ionotropic glutamate receptor NMDA 2B
VFILYSTNKEAVDIMSEAEVNGLTAKSYIWIATQAVIGSNLDAPEEFPIGMLGIHFPSDRESMIAQIPLSLSVFGHALEAVATNSELSEDEKGFVVQSNVSCSGRDEIK